jgi:hypothetical protein
MLRSAQPVTLPCLFVKLNVAVQEPVDEPAATVQSSPEPWVTVAMPEGPPQLSLSVSVPFFVFGVRTETVSGPPLEAVKVTLQGVTRTPPCAVHPPFTLGLNDAPPEEVAGLTPWEPLQPASSAATTAIAGRPRETIDVDTGQTLPKKDELMAAS